MEKCTEHLAIPIRRFWIEAGPEEQEHRLVLEPEGGLAKLRIDIHEAVEALKPLLSNWSDGQLSSGGRSLWNLAQALAQMEARLMVFVRLSGFEKNKGLPGFVLGVRPKTWSAETHHVVVEVTARLKKA